MHCVLILATGYHLLTCTSVHHDVRGTRIQLGCTVQARKQSEISKFHNQRLCGVALIKPTLDSDNQAAIHCMYIPIMSMLGKQGLEKYSKSIAEIIAKTKITL